MSHEGKDQYPNVKSCTYIKGWIEYLVKEDKEPYSEGINPMQFLDAKKTKSRILGKRLLEGDKLQDLV